MENYISTAYTEYTENNHIGDIIRKRRETLRFSQEDLCYGICSTSTISKIETGERDPSRKILECILDRLGIKDEHYYAMTEKKFFKIEGLKYVVTLATMNKDFEKCKELMTELEKFSEVKNIINKQFILRQKVACYNKELSNDEKLQLLNEAILITTPKFDEKRIEDSLLSRNDVNVILGIANVYNQKGEAEKASNIYRQLIEYNDKHFIENEEKARLTILISYNYAISLIEEQRYNKAIEMCDKVLDYCIKYNKMKLMGDTTMNKAYCLCIQGDMLYGTVLYQKSITIFDIMQERQKIEKVKKIAKQYFNIDLNKD